MVFCRVIFCRLLFFVYFVVLFPIFWFIFCRECTNWKKDEKI